MIEVSELKQRRLRTVLWGNKNVFITESSLDIGGTNVVQHTIHLKPITVSKHHKPYCLPPEKREVSRHQLVPKKIIRTIKDLFLSSFHVIMSAVVNL